MNIRLLVVRRDFEPEPYTTTIAQTVDCIFSQYQTQVSQQNRTRLMQTGKLLLGICISSMSAFYVKLAPIS